MKKVLLVGVVAMLSLASCVKDRTCTCTDESGSDKTTIPKSTKSNAETICKTMGDNCKLD